jgi:hypothetical protein
MSDESPFRSLLLPTSTDCISLTGHVASDQQLHVVTAYTVVRRTPEIGIRMALRAERGGVIAMVMRGAVIQTVLGLTIEIPVALLCVRFVKALYEVTSADAGVMMSAIVTLAGAACLAGSFLRGARHRLTPCRL